ncbi:MAG: mucoidy inhibitor MuiA family protein [Kofleriaceae bacterium]
MTVLEDRASITRRGSASLAAGQHRIVIDTVSPVLADKTLHASASGARVLDVRCERYLAPWRDPDSGSTAAPAALREEKHALQREHDAALARASASRAEIDALHELAGAAHRDLAIAAARGTSVVGATTQLAELDAAEAAARARAVAASQEIEALTGKLARLDARIARADAETGEVAARLVVDLLVDAPNDVTLAIGYIVPGAAWRPYHRAVLARAAGRVDWTTTACVWQATGESWTDVDLVFSLERPSLGVDPPELGDDELFVRRRPDTVVVEAREQEQQNTGLGGSPAVPGIDDGGLGITLTAHKVTVEKDGTPHRIPVGGFTAPTTLSLIAIPLKSSWCHIRARITNTGQAPLLAGPVDLVMSSGYVGRAEVGFVAPGEKFYLGFGPESDIRVHRTETRERDDGLLGGTTHTVRVAVRVSNLGAERRTIDITERIPISEVEQVSVDVASPDAYLLGADDQPGPERGDEITQVTARSIDERGLVTWGVELPPLGRRAVTLEYKIKSQRGVAGV